MTATAISAPLNLDVRPVGQTFVAEVEGVDLSQPLDDAIIAAITHAFNSYSILVFRDQDLTEDQHIAFTRRFGELYDHILGQFAHPNYPDILVVSNIIENGRNIGLADAGRLWHADLSYRQPSSTGSMLYAREIPSSGGDTLFADTIGAYEALPDVQKHKVRGLYAVHEYLTSYSRHQQEHHVRPQLTEAQLGQLREVIHPIAFVHPGNGRIGLYVSDGFTVRIVGLPEKKGRALLHELNAHVTQERFQYRHRWRKGDLVFWDNRSTIHLATGGYALPERRLLHRTTLKGPALKPAP